MADIKFVNPATYLKNVTRSISYSALDITKEMVPAGKDLLDTNSETLKEVLKTVKTPKKSLLTLGKQIKKSKVYEAGELAVKATLEDIATGNFYNKQRISEIESRASGIGGLTDFEGMEIDFDELDADIAKTNASDEDDTVTKGDKFVGEIVSESSFAASQAVSKTVVASGRHVAETTKASTALMYNLNVKGFEMISRGVGSVNQNVSHLVDFANVTIKDYMTKTLQQHDKMIKLQEEQTVLLKNIHDMQAALQSKPREQKQSKGGRYEDVMSGDAFDVKAYAKLVAKNIVEETPLKMLKTTDEAMGGEGANVLLNFAASPLKAVTDILIKKAIPDLMKQTMESFNNTLSGFFGTLLYRLTNANEDSFIGSWIKKIFGVKNSVKTSLDTSNYQKGPIPFDGVTKKAIIETIPGYLARIESAITRQDERFYDYKNGIWKDRGDIEREISNIKKSAVDGATGEVKREIEKRLIKEKKFSDEFELRSYMENLDKLLTGIYDGKSSLNGRKFFSPTNKKLKGSDFDIPDQIFSELQAIFATLPRAMQTSFYPKIMQGRDRQNRYMTDLENAGDSILQLGFNNSGTLNKYDKKTGKMTGSGLTFGDLASQTDRYGKNVFFWLKDHSERLLEIARNTSRGGSSSSAYQGRGNRRQGKSISITSELGLTPKMTVEEQLRKDSLKEYEKLYKDNKRSIEKLKEKGYKIPDPKNYDESAHGDVNDYIAELKKSIIVIEELEREDKESKEKKSNKPGFLTKLQGYLNRPAKLITDIFDKADERLYQLMFGDSKEFTTIDGKPVGSVLDIAKIKFNKFFDDLSERIQKKFNHVIEKIKEFLNPYIEKAKEAARPLWESTKDAFKSAGNWVKGGFKEVYEPVKNLFDPSDGTWGMETRVPNIDDVDMLADGTRVMKKTGLAVLSEGEMVIPQNLNPFYKGKRTSRQQQKRNEKLVKNNLSSQLATNAAKYIPGYADGTTNAEPMDPKDLKEQKKEKDPKYMKVDGKWYNFKTEKEVSREEVERYNIITSVFSKAGEEVVSGAKKLVNEIRTVLVGEDNSVKIKEKVDNATSQLFKDAVGEIKGDKIGFGGKAIAGAAIGIGGSLLTGGLLSPILAASLGSATSIVINSEKTRKWLFGEENEEGEYEGGVLPSKLVKGITKYIPSMAKHGAVGALTAMIPFVPGGPIAGLMVGSAVGFMKKNESAQNFLFGEDGLFGKSKEEISQMLKKNMPRILGGAGLGAATGLVLGGPFGLVGNMMIGGGLGFLSTNEKFQKVLFGEKDADGKTIKDGLVQKLTKWTKKNILDQLKDFIKPALNRITHFISRLGKGAGGFFSKQFEKWVGIPLSRAMEEYIFKPLGKIAKPFLKVGKVLVQAMVSPLSLLGGMGRRMQKKDLKRGNSAYLGNAADRLKRREELGMGNNDFYGQLDQALQGMTKEELLETSDLIKQTHTERISNNKNRVNARRELNMNLAKEMGGDFKIKDIKKVSQLIQNGDYKGAQRLINAKVPIGRQRGRFARAGNTEELNEILNSYGAQFNDQVKYNNKYEDKFKEALKSKFGNNKFVEEMMKGRSGELIKMLEKEAASRSPEDNALAQANAEESKFRHTLLDDIKTIREVLTGVKKPRARKLKKKGGKETEVVEDSAQSTINNLYGSEHSNLYGNAEESTDHTESASTIPHKLFNASRRSLGGAKAAAQHTVGNLYGATKNPLYGEEDKKLATRRFRINKPNTAAEEAKHGEEVERKTKKKTVFTKDGVMEYVRNTKGDWIPDKHSETTKDTMADEIAEDTNLAKSATFSEKLFNLFSRKNKKGEGEEDEEESNGLFGKIGSAIKGKIGPILKKILAAIGLISAGGTAMAGAGYLSEKIKDSEIGSKIMTWLFGGVDEDGQRQEGVLTKVGKVIIVKGPEIAARISRFIGDSIINAANFVANNSERVGQWISNGIQLFTNNIVNLVSNAPVIAKALATAIPLVINPIGRAIPPLVESLAKNIGPVMSSIGSALPEIGKALGNAIATLVSQIPTIIVSVLKAAKDVIPELAKGLWEGVKALVKGILHPNENTNDTSTVLFGENSNTILGTTNSYDGTVSYTNGVPTFSSQTNSSSSNSGSSVINGNATLSSIANYNVKDNMAYNMFSTGTDVSSSSNDDYSDSSMNSYEYTDNTGTSDYQYTDNEGISQNPAQYNGRAVDRNRRNKSLDKYNAYYYGKNKGKNSLNANLGTATQHTSNKMEEAAHLKDEEPILIAIQAADGTITYETIGTDDERYQVAKEYKEAQDLTTEVSGKTTRSTDAVVISAVHAARVGLIGTKTGQGLLNKVITKVAEKNPEFAKKLAEAAAKGAKSKVDKFTKNTVKLSTWAGKLAKKIVIDNPRKRKSILKEASEKAGGKSIMSAAKKEASKYTVRGMVKEGVKKGAKKVGKGIAKSVSKAGNFIKSTASKIGKGAKKVGKSIGKVASSVSQKLSGKTPKVVSKAKKVTKDTLKLVKTNITRAFNKLLKIDIVAKFLKGSDKACAQLLEKILKKASAAAAKAGAKLSAGLISGGLFNALLAAYKFTDGMTNAEAYLKVEEANMGQRVISGLALAINEFVLFGLLPEDWIISVLMSTLGKALKVDEQTTKQQEELATLTKEYNEKFGTDFSEEEYNSKVNKNAKGIKGWYNNIFKKQGGTTVNSYGELQQNLNNGKGKSGTGSGKGSAISSLVSQIDPNAPKPILAQVDNRIANKKFGNSTVGESGCAPSSAAILLNDALQKKDIDITDTMKSAVRYQNPDGSVRSDYFKNIFSKYGYSTNYYDKPDDALNRLKKGDEVILLGQDISNTTKTKSPFGPKSHYVVANNYHKGKVTIADPETDGQIAYDQKILKKVQLAIVPRRASGKGSGLSLGGYAGSGGLSSSQVKKNKDIIFNYLTSTLGFSKAGAVGVMANIKAESGFNPDLNEYGNGIGYGLCQWSFGRRKNLEKYAKKKGMAVGSIELQLAFLKKELDSGYKKMVKRLKNYPDTEKGASEAARDFCVTFERPANKVATGNKRAKMAKTLWSEYKDKTGTLTSSSDSSNDTGSIFSSLTSELMKQVYGEDVLSLFGMSSSENEDSSGTMNSEGEIISDSNAKTAKKYFTESMKGSRVTSNYGNRILDGETNFHRGIDIGAKAGTKIPTPVSGKVTRSEYAGTYGNLLVIKDNDGYYHYFAHQQKKPALSVGATVRKGQNIGLVGSTGHSTGPHLHYEVRKKDNQNSTNPDAYLKSYYSKGGSGSALQSPFKEIPKEKFDPKGAKGGGSDYSIDIQILESLVSVISNILVDTHDITEIKNLLSQYFALDGKSNDDSEKSYSERMYGNEKTTTPSMNIINTNQSGENTDERKRAILQQLQALIAQ